MRYLSLCAIVKDEEESYLHEWLLYHHALGVEHFYMYDNESKIPLRDPLRNYINQGWVNVFHTPGKAVQVPAYAHCLHSFRSCSRWIGFLDLDEFIVPIQEQDLRNFLQPYEAFGALGINWLTFGSSSHNEKPGPSQIKHFTQRTSSSFQKNRHIKTILQSSSALSPVTAHHFIYQENTWCVNEHGLRIDGPFSPNSTDKIRINHYYLRSKDQWLKKIARGRADVIEERSDNQLDHFNSIDSSSNIPDDLILQIWNPETQRLVSQLSGSSDKPNDTQYHVPTPLPTDFTPPDSVNLFKLDLELLCNHAMANIQEGIWSAALRIIRVLINRYPKSLDGYLLFSDFLLRTGNLKEAMKCLDHAENQGIPGSFFLRQRGVILNRMGEFQSAENYFRLALQECPSDVINHIQLSRNSLDMGQTTQAYEYLIQAQEIDPENPEISQGIRIIRDRLQFEKSST